MNVSHIFYKSNNNQVKEKHDWKMQESSLNSIDIYTFTF